MSLGVITQLDADHDDDDKDLREWLDDYITFDYDDGPDLKQKFQLPDNCPVWFLIQENFQKDTVQIDECYLCGQ